MSESPLQHLSKEKFQEVLDLAKRVQDEDNSEDGKFWSATDAAQHSKSDAEMALIDCVENLSLKERGELVTVMLIGRGDEKFKGENWNEIYLRSSPLGEHGNYITSKSPHLGSYLEKGIGIVRGI